MQLQRSANRSQQTMETTVHLFLKDNVGFYLCSFGLMFLSAKQTLILVIKDSEARSADVKRSSSLIRCVYYCFLFNKIEFICKLFFLLLLFVFAF